MTSDALRVGRIWLKLRRGARPRFPRRNCCVAGARSCSPRPGTASAAAAVPMERLAGAILALICCLLIIRYNSRIDTLVWMRKRECL